MTRVHVRSGGYSPAQAALILGVTRAELDSLVAAGRLSPPTLTPGGQRRYDLDAVNRLAEAPRG